MSCCPAKLASAESSAVALDRTATGTSSPRAAYASAIGVADPLGKHDVLDEVARAPGSDSTAPRSSPLPAVASTAVERRASSELLEGEAVGVRRHGEPVGDGELGGDEGAEADRLAADEGDVVVAAVAEGLDQIGLGVAPLDEHARRAAEGGVAPVLEGLALDQPQVGKPARELLEHGLHLETSERRSEAEVDPVAEREVAARVLALEIHAIRVGEDALVAIGRPEQEQEIRSLGEIGLADPGRRRS